MSDKIYAKNPDVVFRKIADEFVLVPIRQKAVDLRSIFTLNEVGAFIWNLLDGAKTIAQIKDKVTEEFVVDSHQAETDIAQIVSQLESLGLIQEA
jgi:hypothetical protein